MRAAVFHFLIKLGTNYYVFCCIIILLSFSYMFHHMLVFFVFFFSSRISSFSVKNEDDFDSVPFPFVKVKITVVFLVFPGTICSCSSKASEWLILISDLPLYTAVSRRDSSLLCSFLTFPQVHKCHSGLLHV